MSIQRRKPPEEFLRAFGNAIVRLRKRRQLSQEQLALRAEMHRSYVSDIERGVRNPTVAVIKLLADVLDAKPSELFRMAEKEHASVGGRIRP